jgi:hypothetical protein
VQQLAIATHTYTRAYIVALHACRHLITLNVDFVRFPHVLGVCHHRAEQAFCIFDVLAQVLALSTL